MQRTILLRQRLKPNKNDRAQVMAWGDVHFGSETCQTEYARERLDHALKNKMYVLAMGDICEIALVGGKSDVYGQRLTPEAQIDYAVEALRPLSKAGLLLGLLTGNHERRIWRATSMDVTKIMAKELGVPYLGHSCFCLFWVGKQSYTVYATHGSSGARMSHSKLRIALDMFKSVSADVLLMGHVHDLCDLTQLYREVDKRGQVVKEYARHAVITGHYLGYRDSYAEEKDLPPSRTGSPTINFHGNEHTVRVVI